MRCRIAVHHLAITSGLQLKEPCVLATECQQLVVTASFNDRSVVHNDD
jgi:hypothetical protein